MACRLRYSTKKIEIAIGVQQGISAFDTSGGDEGVDPTVTPRLRKYRKF
jgi:hypothetical protein